MGVPLLRTIKGIRAEAYYFGYGLLSGFVAHFIFKAGNKAGGTQLVKLTIVFFSLLLCVINFIKEKSIFLF